MNEDTPKIRSLNDRFRTNIPGGDGVPGHLLFTTGIQTLCDTNVQPNTLLPALLAAVRSFNTFTNDNDPHREHDFGAFDFQGVSCFWKIDVLDPSLDIAPLDATDPTLSVRVLTIMTAAEY
jgi:hypothetical protein